MTNAIVCDCISTAASSMPRGHSVSWYQRVCTRERICCVCVCVCKREQRGEAVCKTPNPDPPPPHTHTHTHTHAHAHSYTTNPPLSTTHLAYTMHAYERYKEGPCRRPQQIEWCPGAWRLGAGATLIRERRGGYEVEQVADWLSRAVGMGYCNAPFAAC